MFMPSLNSVAKGEKHFAMQSGNFKAQGHFLNSKLFKGQTFVCLFKKQFRQESQSQLNTRQ
jgi:hypothetical protein